MSRLIGIVAATGGLETLPVILGGLPREFASPILVVQAMPDSFLKTFVARLAEKCLLPVAPAEDGQVPEPGHVYAAGTDHHLLIEQGQLRFTAREPRVFDTMDMLFRSMAREQGPGAVAVILTGMGTDGARGMKDVRDVGGYTIAQDEDTSIVYGMPRVAVQLDAACESLPLQEIAPRLLTLDAISSRGA